MSYFHNTGRIRFFKQVRLHKDAIFGRVLDIGAGNFSRYKELFNFDEYVRMDIEPRKDIDIVGRIEEIPLPDNAFDSVVCTQVLGDVYELHKAFEEMHRVLRPNGIALITESLLTPLHDEPHDYWRFTEHSLRRLAEDAGFEILVLERCGGYRSVMAQMRARYLIERLSAHGKWFSRLLGFYLKMRGRVAEFLDRRDATAANKLFTHGYVLIAKKNA